MRIDFINKTAFTFTKKTVSDILDKVAAKFFSDSKSLVVEVLFVEEKEITALNQRWRGVDRPTDVLSFPQFKIPSAEQHILGSIVIAPEIALKRGEKVRDLLGHGFLHLLGFDHEKDEKRWREAARKIDYKT